MILITGLGNPGKEYEKTPHNMGFWVLDYFKARYFPSKDWARERTLIDLTTEELALMKPLQYMNRSGFTIKNYMETNGISPENLWVVHDEFDLLWGEVKVDFDRSSAGHKGVQSIIDELGTQKFWRFRVGVKPAQELAIPLDEYLTKTTENITEKQEEELLSTITALLFKAIKDGIDKTRITIHGNISFPARDLPRGGSCSIIE